MRVTGRATATLEAQGRTSVRVDYTHDYLPLTQFTVVLGDLTITHELGYAQTVALRDELSAYIERMEAAGESLAGSEPVTRYEVAS